MDVKLSHLNLKDGEAVNKIIRDHPEVSANSFEDLKPSTISVTHRFELTSENPVYQKAGRMSPSVHEIDRMLLAGIITPVESSWTSHVVIATKKDGSPRFCVNYRKLNSILHADRWTLPRVDEILDDMRGSSVFTTIDLFQGYWQIKMDETCKEKAAFICTYGNLQFEVMPFELMNSQVTFQRMMDRVLLKFDNVRCYVDDVIVSKNIEEHAMHLQNVFRILKDKGLRLRIKICSFMQLSVELLGNIVDKNGVHVDDRKVKKVKDAIPPTTRQKLRSFLGLASYYRRFILGFAKIAKPLNEKTLDKVKFVWSEEMQNAFEELKVKLTSTPVLAYLDYEKPFVVCTNASSRAVRAVLSRTDGNGRDHTKHYASRALSVAESNYSAFEKEALGVTFALNKFRHYLTRNRFKLYTDYQAIKYVFNMKDPHGWIAR